MSKLFRSRVAVRPNDGFVASETVPVKPLRLMTAMVVSHVAPVLQLIVIGLEGWMLKSVTWTWNAGLVGDAACIESPL